MMRRLCGFYVSGEVISQFCRNGPRQFSVGSLVPDTAQFFSAYFDQSRSAFVCIFEDETFPLLSDGAFIPIGPGIEITDERCMGQSEDYQNEIDRAVSQQDPKEVLVSCIANLIEAKIDSAFYNVGIGGQPSRDPMQAVAYNERLLVAVLERFTSR